jgi:hypothetical protein
MRVNRCHGTRVDPIGSRGPFRGLRERDRWLNVYPRFGDTRFQPRLSEHVACVLTIPSVDVVTVVPLTSGEVRDAVDRMFIEPADRVAEIRRGHGASGS